jgi:transposase
MLRLGRSAGRDGMHIHGGSKYLYRARNLVERFFNKVKHFRRIATRDDKLAENFLAALKLAAILMWLRNSESTFWPWPGLSS